MPGSVPAVRSRAGLLAAIAAVALVLGWWAWPSLSGADDELDVVVVRDDFLGADEREVTLRIREEGTSVEWTGSGAGWCADPVDLDALAGRAGRIVLALDGDEACLDALATSVSDRTLGDLLAVVRPGAPLSGDALAAAGLDVVDPTALLGGPASGTSLPCEWWESPCPPTGAVVLWDDTGLTAVGAGRLGRAIVADL